MIFERRTGAPAGSIKVTTGKNTYTLAPSGTIDVTDREDIDTLRQHPFLQVQGGQLVTQVNPAISDVYLRDGVAIDAGTGAPVGSQSLGLGWMEVCGHSLAAGGGARNAPWGGYAYMLQHALGIPNIHDYAIGGSVACRPLGATNDGGSSWVLRNLFRPGQTGVTAPAAAPYNPQSQLVLCHFGLNDMGRLGANKPLPWQVAMRTILAAYCASAWFAYDHSSWAFTGTWPTLGIGDASASSTDTKGISYSQTVGDKATWTAPADMPAGRVVGVRLWLSAAAAVNTYGVRVRRSGVWTTLPDLVIDTAAMTDQGIASLHQVHTVRFGSGVSGDPYGAINLAAGDAIELTLSATINSGSLAIDGAHIESDPLDGPIFVCPLPNRPANYGIWTSWAGFSTMNDAAVDTWKGYERDILAEFPGRVISDSRGLGIDIDDAGLNRYTATPGTSPPPAGVMPDFLNDGAHPNEHGHGMWAEHIAKWVRRSPLITDRVRARPYIDPRPRAWRQVGKLTTAGPYSTGWSALGAAGIPDLQWRIDDQRRVFWRGAAKAAAGAQINPVNSANPGPKPIGVASVQANQYTGSAWNPPVIVRVPGSGGTAGVVGLLSLPPTAAGNFTEFEFSYQSES